MKKLLALLTCTLLATSIAKAGVSLTFNDHNGTPNAGSYHPGDSFTFSITLHVTGGSPADAISLSYWFETSAANNSLFTIVSRKVGNSHFSDTVQNPNGDAIVDGGNEHDLGGSANSGQGTNKNFFIANITIQISASAAPGPYSINTTTASDDPKVSIVSDNATFKDFPIPAAAYNITVVPEPSTWAMVTGGGLLLFLAAMTRRRRRAPTL